MEFSHDKLDVYRVSLEFVSYVGRVASSMGGNNRHVRDQLLRSSMSVSLNIAEGNGKRADADRKRFFEIARGSAMESAAALDVLVALGGYSSEQAHEGKTLLFRIVSMLSKMTQKMADSVRETTSEYQVDGEDNSDHDFDYDYGHEDDHDHEDEQGE